MALQLLHQELTFPWSPYDFNPAVPAGAFPFLPGVSEGYLAWYVLSGGQNKGLF